MQTKTPCTDYIETKGLIYFARMLDKIRLKAAGKLPPDYFTGVEDPTHFDARCTRFLGVNYDELAERTLQGGSDEDSRMVLCPWPAAERRGNFCLECVS